MPAVAEEHRNDQIPELVEHRDDLARAGALGERGEVANVEEQDRDLDLLPLQIGSLSQHPVGERGVDVGAEGLAQPLALVEPLDHRVEGLGQLAGLVGGHDRHAGGEITRAHLLGGLLQVAHRAAQRADDEDHQLERDGE